MSTRGQRRIANAFRVAAGLALASLGVAAVWPSPQYQRDPVRFAREVIGVEPWKRQVDILEAAKKHRRVAVSSGHKVSKSHSAAILALWFYCSFDDARVVMSSTTSRQVDQILWRELRMLHARAALTIDGEPAQLARSGLKSDDFREIVGFTAREAEAVAGVSGKNLLYVVDEASGVPDEIFEAIEGNRAGGARLIMFSNPTRTEGEFYRAFTDKAEFYHTIRISSEESPNVVAGEEVIPGLATREWVEEKRREWGEESALYKIRVKGEHALKEDGKILSVHTIAEAESRWLSAPAIGRLHLGVDPAGPGEAGDESVFAPRRGVKVLELVAFQGLNEEAHVVRALEVLRRHREPRDLPPIIVLDREGPIGARVFGMFRTHADNHPNDFELVAVRASDRASREPFIYDRARDELWANLADWLVTGEGAIPPDAKLQKELHAPSWVGQVTGRLKATDKKELRKILGRSPDRADAVALSVWETGLSAPPLVKAPPPDDDHDGRAERTFDPYDGANWGDPRMAA